MSDSLEADIIEANEQMGEALVAIGMALGLPRPDVDNTWGAPEILALIESGGTEWGAKWSDAGYCPASPVRDEEFARRHVRMFGTRPIRRHVGPWVYADTGEVVWL